MSRFKLIYRDNQYSQELWHITGAPRFVLLQLHGTEVLTAQFFSVSQATDWLKDRNKLGLKLKLRPKLRLVK